jgi:hypothetical protein
LGSLVEGTKPQQASRHAKARSLVLAAFTRKPGGFDRKLVHGTLARPCP